MRHPAQPPGWHPIVGGGPSSRRRSASTTRAAVALAVALLLGGCAGDDDGSAADTGSGPSTPAPVAPAPSSPTTASGGSSTPPPSTTAGTAVPPVADGWQDAQARLEVVAEVPQAIAMTPRAGSLDLYVASRTGSIWRVGRQRDAATGTERWDTEPELVLDLEDEVTLEGERGLLGITFSPDGATLYVSYTDLDGRSILEAVAVPGTVADPATRRVLLTVDQPYVNHNGGHVLFGPDGLLYVGLGDGGSSGDPDGHGQDTDTLLGSLLRIEPTPDAAEPYAIPADNPFATGGGAAEIWLWGVRNPWRFSFDRATGDLWLADVGQNAWEEIDLLPAAGGVGAGRAANLGWDQMEGVEPYDDGEEPADHHPPIHVYARDDGRCSVIGGVTYRGALVPALRGVHLYGDLCTGEIRGLVPTGGGATDAALSFTAEPGTLASFGEDGEGEVYVLELAGRVSRVVAG